MPSRSELCACNEVLLENDRSGYLSKRIYSDTTRYLGFQMFSDVLVLCLFLCLTADLSRKDEEIFLLLLFVLGNDGYETLLSLTEGQDL